MRSLLAHGVAEVASRVRLRTLVIVVVHTGSVRELDLVEVRVVAIQRELVPSFCALIRALHHDIQNERIGIRHLHNGGVSRAKSVSVQTRCAGELLTVQRLVAIRKTTALGDNVRLALHAVHRDGREAIFRDDTNTCPLVHDRHTRSVVGTRIQAVDGRIGEFLETSLVEVRNEVAGFHVAVVVWMVGFRPRLISEWQRSLCVRWHLGSRVMLVRLHRDVLQRRCAEHATVDVQVVWLARHLIRGSHLQSNWSIRLKRQLLGSIRVRRISLSAVLDVEERLLRARRAELVNRKLGVRVVRVRNHAGTSSLGGNVAHDDLALSRNASWVQVRLRLARHVARSGKLSSAQKVNAHDAKLLDGRNIVSLARQLHVVLLRGCSAVVRLHEHRNARASREEVQLTAHRHQRALHVVAT